MKSSATFIALGDSAVFMCNHNGRMYEPVTFTWQDEGKPLQAMYMTDGVSIYGESYSIVQWDATGGLGAHSITCTAIDADGFSSSTTVPITIMLGMGRWDVVGYFHTLSTIIQAAALPDDRALFVGWPAGQLIPGQFRASPTYIEIVDPRNRAIISAGAVNDSIERVVPLLDGNVLLTMSTTALLFSPISQSFSPTGTPLWDTIDSAALRLADGDVLFVNPNTRAMVYKQLVGNFVSVGSTTEIRPCVNAVLLTTDKAVIGGSHTYLEIYDPQSQLFTEYRSPPFVPVNIADAMDSCNMSNALPNGKVLFIYQGDYGLPFFDPSIAQYTVLFNSQTGILISAGTMTAGRLGLHTSSLQDGRVLASGGFFYNNAQVDFLNVPGGLMKTSELYYPQYNFFVPAAPLHIPRAGHVAVTLADGRVLVAGGEQAEIWGDYSIFLTYRGGGASFSPTASIEIYTP